MKYILDADWTINALAGKRSADTELNNLLADGVAISWITVGEIYEGAFGFPSPQVRLAAFRAFFQQLAILNLNDPLMERFAEIRTYLRQSGQIISDFDILLGATALHHGLIVLTFNRRHLGRIPNLQLY